MTLETLERFERKSGVSYFITRDKCGSPSSLCLLAPRMVAGGVELTLDIYTNDIELLVTHMVLAMEQVKPDWFAVTLFVDEDLFKHALLHKIIAAAKSHMSPEYTETSTLIVMEREVEHA